jgi:hypothetical protein
MSGLSVREQVSQSLDGLSEHELQQVAEFVAFLRFRARIAQSTAVDSAQLQLLYAQDAEEDRQLAEEGIAEYLDLLHAEDRQ